LIARVGPHDLGPWESARPGPLRDVAGLEPEPTGTHVRLDGRTLVRTTQRLALSDAGGDAVVGLWPAEPKPRAEFPCRGGRSAATVAAGRERGWGVAADPRPAFRTAPAARRMYMLPSSPPRSARAAGREILLD
jgi:hypothetical protein